jgi:hypothetical protein
MTTLFGEKDYRQLEDGETYVGKFVIVKPEFFKSEFRSAKYQLFYATGGFGCDPTKMGNAVFGADFDESYRQERYNILGVATEEAIKEWEKLYGMSRDVIIEKSKSL